MATYQEFYRRSIDQPDAFWSEQAQLVDWQTPFSQVCDFSRPPFAKWFVGGKTNLCHNAVDRHAAKRPDAPALIFVSTETDEEKTYSFAELKTEVMRMAAIYKSLGVKKGDRVKKGDTVIGKVSNIMGGRPNTSIHLHFDCKTTHPDLGIKVHIPIYTSLVAAYRRAWNLPDLVKLGVLLNDPERASRHLVKAKGARLLSIVPLSQPYQLPRSSTDLAQNYLRDQ